jgi:hypothetical protein
MGHDNQHNDPLSDECVFELCTFIDQMNFGNVYRPGCNCAARPTLAYTHAVMFTSNDRWPIFTSTQAAIGSASYELRLLMYLPTRLELRRNAAPRDDKSTRFTSNSPDRGIRSRPDRLRPGAQPSLFTRAKREPRTPIRVISSPAVDAFTSSLTHVG